VSLVFLYQGIGEYYIFKEHETGLFVFNDPSKDTISSDSKKGGSLCLDGTITIVLCSGDPLLRLLQ